MFAVVVYWTVDIENKNNEKKNKRHKIYFINKSLVIISQQLNYRKINMRIFYWEILTTEIQRNKIMNKSRLHNKKNIKESR